ncbi:hypothetical protein [Alicyclobacillus fodiniaquatilis]|uniref:Uncharacterized protein n=1 Tax=Alicyclobacillus fodiniaquatilis TaxID=1661150 RepID=A0ABW4JIG9_9BACL
MPNLFWKGHIAALTGFGVLKYQLRRLQRGDLPEMTGKAWFFCAVIVAVVMVFGPQAVDIVKTALANSLNTTSSSFNFNNF